MEERGISSRTRRNPEVALIVSLVVNEGPGTTRVTLSTFEMVVCCEPVKPSSTDKSTVSQSISERRETGQLPNLIGDRSKGRIGREGEGDGC